MSTPETTADLNAAHRAWREHKTACGQCAFAAVRGMCRRGAGILAWMREAQDAESARRHVPAPEDGGPMPYDVCAGCGQAIRQDESGEWRTMLGYSAECYGRP